MVTTFSPYSRPILVKLSQLDDSCAAAARERMGPVTAADIAKDSSRFQSGLLSLAMLHASHGHTDRALMALQEMIRISQQHGDAAMLVHALAGLASVLRQTPLGPHGTAGQHRPLPVTAAHHAQVHQLLHRWAHMHACKPWSACSCGAAMPGYAAGACIQVRVRAWLAACDECMSCKLRIAEPQNLCEALKNSGHVPGAGPLNIGFTDMLGCAGVPCKLGTFLFLTSACTLRSTCTNSPWSISPARRTPMSILIQACSAPCYMLVCCCSTSCRNCSTHISAAFPP